MVSHVTRWLIKICCNSVEKLSGLVWTRITKLCVIKAWTWSNLPVNSCWVKTLPRELRKLLRARKWPTSCYKKQSSVVAAFPGVASSVYVQWERIWPGPSKAQQRKASEESRFEPASKISEAGVNQTSESSPHFRRHEGWSLPSQYNWFYLFFL